MFELTFVQKLMLLGLGVSYLWFFMWIWKNPTTNWKSKGWGFSLKRTKESPSSMGYTPAEGYFGQIEDTKKKVARGWFKR